MKKLPLLLLLLCLLTNYSFAQTKPQNFKAQYEAQYLEAGLNSSYLDEFFEHRVNLSQYQKYEKLGVDLKQVSHTVGRGFKSSVLTTPVMVIGKVTAQKGNPSRKAFYHRTYTLEVDQILLNDTSFPITLETPIYLKQMSGPMYDINGKKALLYTDNYIDKQLVMHQEYLFFLLPLQPEIAERKRKNDPFTLEADSITVYDYGIRDYYPIVAGNISVSSEEVRIKKTIKWIKRINALKFDE